MACRAWVLQGATNGYSLVFLSLLIGVWVLWFVAARRQWQALSVIAAATALSVLPFVPILYKYVKVHAYHGFERSTVEAVAFGADVSAILCAPDGLSFWGWLRVGCFPEGELLREVELFPEIALLALCSLYVWRTLRRTGRPLSPTLSSTTGFYLFAALATWSLALGPTVKFMGVSTGVDGPFAWLLAMPGVNQLRVPARFWLMTVLCLAVVAGTSMSMIIRGRSKAVRGERCYWRDLVLWRTGGSTVFPFSRRRAWRRPRRCSKGPRSRSLNCRQTPVPAISRQRFEPWRVNGRR